MSRRSSGGHVRLTSTSSRVRVRTAPPARTDPQRTARHHKAGSPPVRSGHSHCTCVLTGVEFWRIVCGLPLQPQQSKSRDAIVCVVRQVSPPPRPDRLSGLFAAAA